jgi:glycosyltransferase involved in cell wall biosynthesis
LKVLFPIGTLYPSQAGGPSNTIYWLAQALSARGVQVQIVATNSGIRQGTVAFDEWLDTDYGRVCYTTDRWHQLPLGMIGRAAKALKTADVLHLNSIFYPPSWILATLGVWQRKKIIWSVRGELDEQALRFSRWKKKPILFLVQRLLAHRVTFHTTSAAETTFVRQIFGATAQVIEIPNYLTLPKRVTRQEKPNALLFIGRIHPIKGVERLIQALAASPIFRQTATTLTIAGDADNAYGASLRQLSETLGLSEKIAFIGHIEGAAKQQLFADAYFTFMPSFSENFGNVVIESLAQGTPVVASTGTPWAHLTSENAGFWCDNEVPTLTQMIDTVLTIDRDAYAQMRIDAERLAKNYDVMENVDTWITQYHPK